MPFLFQAQSAENHFEHLLSLLRFQCAMVADRDVGKGVEIGERFLLGAAIGDLHAELLDGFQAWRKKLIACEVSSVKERTVSEMPPLGGVKGRHFHQR